MSALGLAAGAGLAGLVSTLTTKEQMAAWGWRIPFLIALPLALGTLWLRFRLDDTPEFADMVARK